MSAAKQTEELVARLKKEGRSVTDKAHAAEISARIKTHAPHLQTEWDEHQDSQSQDSSTQTRDGTTGT